MAIRETQAQKDRKDVVQREVRDTNPDPITGAPGSHPVGVGVGAAAGATAGAMVGSVVPGAGTVIGAAIGTIVGAIGGGYLGKGAAEAIDPTAEDAYWRENLKNQTYYDDRYTFVDDYGPAYGYGYATRPNWPDQPFDTVEPELRGKWEDVKGKSRLEWEQARGAVSDAWNRYDQVKPPSRGRA